MKIAEKGIEKMRDLVFISYATEKVDYRMSDWQVADMIYSALKSEGINCWVAHRDIAPGLNWPDEISKAISQSMMMVLVVSSNTQKSSYVSMEVTQAINENLNIIPFFIEKVSLRGGLKLFLSNSQWINAYPQPQKKHLDQLVESILSFQEKTQVKPPILDDKKQPKMVKEIIEKTEKKQKKSLPHKPILIIASIIIIFIASFILIIGFLNSNKTTKVVKIPRDQQTAQVQIEKLKKHASENNLVLETKLNQKGFWEVTYKEYDITMIYIPPGKFNMGSNDGNDDEKPLHEVDLDGYWICKYEVTFDQYDQYCEENTKKKPGDEEWGRGKHPVINVSWYDAEDYCKWLSKRIGLPFKLPTEAQWEKAAHGIDSLKYPWGNNEPHYNGNWYANYTPDTWNKRGEDGFENTAPVGSYPHGASPYGLLDMAGNVYEWCKDRYGFDYYKKSPSKNPQGPDSGTYFVIRGGGWTYNARALSCVNRCADVPFDHYIFVGFRLCQDIK